MSSTPQTTTTRADEPSPRFRNVDSPTAYVGDAACATCHAAETSAYRQQRWTGAELDMLTDAGHPIASGPYRARVQGSDARGRLAAAEFVYFGIVRQRVE